ncbi:MAG TPA: SGNH/GDSL hydrolase family protein [Verrucomicrobiae bacterium]|nr:SGNH/GDSL hydrolase family protein [Verrucomicrobiae bacterium]
MTDWRERVRRPRLVSLALTAGLVLAGTAAGVAVAEVAFRLFPQSKLTIDLRDLHELRPDRPWLYGMRPGTARVAAGVRYAVNADGFRDRAYARPKPPGTFRVVVIGDSLAFGYGVPLEASFPKLLEASLVNLLPGAEVLNLGVCGYNPFTEAALFTDVGITYEPDLVLVEFCVNDLNDPTLHFDFPTFARLPDIPAAAFPDPERKRAFAPPSLAERLCRASRACAFVRDRLFPPRLDAATIKATLVTRDDPSESELRWLRARYEEIARAARARGARFAVVVFPYATQLDGRAPARLNERLVDLGREAGWVTIDLLPAFRAAAVPGAPPLLFDLWHPTVAGHRVAAEALLRALRCAGLLPLPPDAGCAP